MNNEQDIKESNDSSDLKFKSRPLTAGGGVKNSVYVRFFATAMNALDRIEGLLEEIEETKTLVHQMIGEFSVIGCVPARVTTRLTSDGRKNGKKKVRAEKKEEKETAEFDTPRYIK